MSIKMSEKLKFEIDDVNSKHGPEAVIDILTTCIATTLVIGWVDAVHEDLVEGIMEDIRDKLAILKPYRGRLDSDEMN